MKEKTCCAVESPCCENVEEMAKAEDAIREMVRESYAKRAVGASSCCGETGKAKDTSKRLGYSKEDLEAVPDGSNLGLGCGNPIALASLKEGETVLDLGSGAGFDCFLAANRVGKNGKIIGVDMTSEMLGKARENALNAGYENVEFRLGEIENLPVANDHVDVIISNCVINLVPNKRKVFNEAFRVLKPGGRLMVSDMVLLKELPESVKNSPEAYACCIAGAVMKDEYLACIEEAGFQEVKVIDDTVDFSLESVPEGPVAGRITSIQVSGLKPTD